MPLGERVVRGLVDHRRAWNHDAGVRGFGAHRFEQVVRATNVDGQRRLGCVPRSADVRRSGAVIHGRRTRLTNRALDRATIQEVYGLPRCPRAFAQRLVSGPVPRDELGRVSSEKVDEMASGEPGRSGDDCGSRHLTCRAQRGTPLMAPLNGEKFPRPANVNDMKKRRSAGMASDVPLRL